MDQTNRYIREISGNKESVRLIANSISSSIKRVLSSVELQNLMHYIKSHKSQEWNQLTTAQIRERLVKGYLSQKSTKLEALDIHELLREQLGTKDSDSVSIKLDQDGEPIISSNYLPDDEVASAELGSIDRVREVANVINVERVAGVASFMGKSDELDVQQLLNPSATWRKNYILLDTRYRDTTQDDGGPLTSFAWNFLANSSTNTVGGVNSLGDVQQVVALQSGNLRLPYQNNAFLNSYKRITLLINEFGGQSYIGQEGRKFHFIYSTTVDGNMVDCQTLPAEKSMFEFAKPITQLDTITLSFASPLELLKFDMDRMYMSVTYATNTSFKSTLPHNLQTGDLIYITDFRTTTTTHASSYSSSINSDALLSVQINSASGNTVTVIDDTTVTIAVDSTNIYAPISPFIILVYFGSKRIFVPLEIRYVAGRNKVV